LIRGNPRFVEYFRAATPSGELSYLNIGSRPAKRNVQGGIESLRAIPWIFAWTQTRLLLPAWLGVGEALELAAQEGLGEELKTMYAEWPFFQSTVDLVEMVLSYALLSSLRFFFVASWHSLCVVSCVVSCRVPCRVVCVVCVVCRD
jgi:phosphoenolpyruvate carboxylase